METNIIYNEDTLTGLRTLPDDCVDCCVTSPPYYGLRDYGTATWEGGDPLCHHAIREEAGFDKWKQSTNRGNAKRLPKSVCPKCGAIRVDKQIGLEDTPEDYISRLTEVFREVRRVLKPNGTCWVNIGDSYWGGKGYSASSAGIYQYERRKAGKSITKECSNIGGKGIIRPTDRKHDTIKAKDLIGIPRMLAFSLRADGWYLRQEIIWNKPNPMPESVTDRCTKSHEHIFLLTKQPRYYFDSEAILELAAFDGRKDTTYKGGKKDMAGGAHERWANRIKMGDNEFPARNKRDVWTVNTRPCKEAHSAVYPEELIKPCILAGCPESGIVLDPFIGSGTTAIVARSLNRNFIGFELNPDYIAIAYKRINLKLGMFQ